MNSFSSNSKSVFYHHRVVSRGSFSFGLWDDVSALLWLLNISKSVCSSLFLVRNCKGKKKIWEHIPKKSLYFECFLLTIGLLTFWMVLLDVCDCVCGSDALNQVRFGFGSSTSSDRLRGFHRALRTRRMWFRLTATHTHSNIKVFKHWSYNKFYFH